MTLGALVDSIGGYFQFAAVTVSGGNQVAVRKGQAINMKWAVLALLFLTVVPALGQTESPALSACEPNPAVESGLRPLNRAGIVSFIDMDERAASVENLLRKHPDDRELNFQEQVLGRNGTQAERTAMIRSYEQQFQKHPDDPLYQYLYATALFNVNTPQSIDLLTAILKKHPTYPWPHFMLASIYFSGKYADPASSLAELDAFFSSCPRTMERHAWDLRLESATPEIAGRYAAQLRKQLGAENNLDHFQMWEYIWDLDFKAAPPSEHERVRRQMAIELARLENIQDPPDVALLATLKKGYTMLGNESELERIYAVIVKNFPDSVAAKRVWDQQWWKEHPAPKEDDPAEKKQASYKEETKFFAEQLKTWPKDTLLVAEYFDVLNKVNSTSPEQISAAADMLLASIKHNPQDADYKTAIARAFVRRQMRLKEVPALVEEAAGTFWIPDDISDEMKANMEDYALRNRVERAEILTDLAFLLHKPEVAEDAIHQLGDRPPKSREIQPEFWAVKAKFAELNGRKLNALILYRTAIQAWPQGFNGPTKDELSDNESRLWKELNGGNEVRALFESNPGASHGESGWQRPARTMPPWELSDLSGRTWRLTGLKGKIVFINVWATWCMPCREELPYLQQLYERVKERPDVRLLTFNVDREPGLVGPFMKQMGYTFPVLLADDYVGHLISDLSIPRNWIVDSNGNWVWQTIDLNPAEWPDRVLQKIEASRTDACLQQQ
jgi:thiol-disulfide isomerase/thioredoxin